MVWGIARAQPHYESEVFSEGLFVAQGAEEVELVAGTPGGGGQPAGLAKARRAGGRRCGKVGASDDEKEEVGFGRVRSFPELKQIMVTGLSCQRRAAQPVPAVRARPAGST